MRSPKSTNIAAYLLLAGTATVSLLLPRNLSTQSSVAAPLGAPETLSLTGMVRDFQKTHSGFNVTLASGNGHYAGNVITSLSAADRPAFSGGGYKVNNQWRDLAANPIPPHLYRNAAEARAVRLVSSPTITDKPTMDTFDSTAGPYGAGNVGPAPNFVTGSTMPTLTAPTGLPAKVTDYIKSGTGTTTLTTDVHCAKFVLQNSHTLQISGHRIIYAEELFKVENQSKIVILANSSLTLYTGKDVVFENSQEVNMNTGDPSRFRIFHLGTQTIVLENTARIYAQIVAPNAMVQLQNDCHMYGSLTAKSTTLQNGAGLHIDTIGTTKMCGVDLADTAGAAGAMSAAGIASAAAFNQWYVDEMGVNLSAQHTIHLVKGSDNAWEYSSDAFFPIDGMLFGNEGMSHNYFFTYTIGTSFTHHSCDGRFFEFQGADDAWLFVNGRLAIDLGGIVPNQRQRVDLDRLNLIDGKEYRIEFFYAQRNPSVAWFHIRTNLDLDPSPADSVVSAGHD